MRYLFICSYGQSRSPTAARVAEELAEERGIDLEADYLGLVEETSSEVVRRLQGADKVVVMEPWMEWDIKNKHRHDGEVVCWNVKDIYDYYDPKFVEICRERLREDI